MRRGLTRLAVAIAGVAAFAVGSTALASARHESAPPAAPAQAQRGEQSTADTPAEPVESKGEDAAFVDNIDGKLMSFEGRERRAHARYVVAIPSVVQPLDEAHQPRGKPSHAATRDISVGESD